MAIATFILQFTTEIFHSCSKIGRHKPEFFERVEIVPSHLIGQLTGLPESIPAEQVVFQDVIDLFHILFCHSWLDLRNIIVGITCTIVTVASGMLCCCIEADALALVRGVAIETDGATVDSMFHLFSNVTLIRLQVEPVTTSAKLMHVAVFKC